jgi:glutamine synthetase
LEAADRAILFKAGVKDLSHPLGILPSFMAKPNASLPGCGQHFHQNLASPDGTNLFYDASDPNKMSALFKHYLAGQLHCLPEILPMFAPTVNSYKRLVEGYWAPTTPTWGVENRTVSFRVIPSGKSARVEVRYVTNEKKLTTKKNKQN